LAPIPVVTNDITLVDRAHDNPFANSVPSNDLGTVPDLDAVDDMNDVTANGRAPAAGTVAESNSIKHFDGSCSQV
jgi:hypothetical protein